MSVTRSEQETVFRFAPDEGVVEVYTAYPPVARKLERAGMKPYRTTVRDGVDAGWFFRVPVAKFKWAVREPRKLSEEQKAKMGARLNAKRAV